MSARTNWTSHPISEGAAGAVRRRSVRFIASAGPVVRLELKRDDNGSSMDAEISRDRYRELSLRVGDKVDVTPRNLRTFSS